MTDHSLTTFLRAQRLYGDFNETAWNNNVANATVLGIVADGATVSIGSDAISTTVAATSTDFVSIDDESDIDVYRFTITAEADLDLLLTPVGPTYNQAPQGGGQTSFDASAQSDLTLQLVDSNGTTVLATAAANGIGQSETIDGFGLSEAGEYYVRISGAQSNVQMYRLQITANHTVIAPEIDIQGSGNSIADGDLIAGDNPNNDHTDFGQSDVVAGSSRETYLIVNQGTVDLTISAISISGAAADDFVLNQPFTGPLAIAPQGSFAFTVDFDPSATGTRNAIVHIRSDDADEGQYDFAITGKGINATAATVLINEVDSSDVAVDDQEFIELFGPAGTPLDGLVLVLFSGDGDAAYDAIDLDGQSIPGDGYFVIGSSAVPNVDLVAFTTDGLRNGADAVGLYTGDASAIDTGVATATAASTANLRDAIVYDTSDADDVGLLAALGELVQFDENSHGAQDTESLQRIPSGAEVPGGSGGDDFTAAAATPGTASVTADITPPTVTDLIVAGVGGGFGSWASTFIDAVDDSGPSGPDNGLGFSVLGVTRTIPWYHVNTFYIRYSEQVSAPTGLSLLGVNVANYAGLFTISHSGDLTTVTMTSPFGLPETDFGPATTGIDRLRLTVAADGVTDLAGNAMVGDFSQEINVLPGDANGSGNVSSADVGLTNFRGFTEFGGPANGLGFSYDPFYDINSSGGISSADVGLTNLQGFDELPAPLPPPPAATSVPNGLQQRERMASKAERWVPWELAVDRVFKQHPFSKVRFGWPSQAFRPAIRMFAFST